MKPRRAFRPDLNSAALEERLSPVVANLGVIVLTTGGYYLLIPFPGLFPVPSTISNSAGATSAPSANGTPINTSFFILGNGGISTVQPGNITGFPAFASVGLAGAGRGPAIVINVGSGADESAGPSIAPVTRNTIANDALNPAPLIGGRPSGENSPVLPTGQSYRNTAPAQATGTANGNQTTVAPPSTSGASTPPPRYPPSVVPVAFPFTSPPGSSGAPADSLPGNPAPSMPPPPARDRPPAPGR